MLVYNAASAPLGGVGNKAECSNAVRSIIASMYEVHVHLHCHACSVTGMSCQEVPSGEAAISR